MSEFACSVVVASHKRPDPLDRLLEALAAQETDAPIEVIVILDGESDSSRDVLIAWEERAVFASFRWYEQSRKGLASARNRGAFLARAPVLVFLDDDVVPEPDLISVHLRHHEADDRIAVLGDYELVRAKPKSLCELSLWTWWETTFHRRSAPGQPSGFRDFCGCNVSLRREDFARVRGFDPDFTVYGREDYDLGYRLLRSGVRFVPDRGARARHYKAVTVRSTLRAKRHEAHGDVLMASKHPELIRGLTFMSAGDKRSRRISSLAMSFPWVGDCIYFARVALLWIPERLRRRRRWLAKFEELQAYAYWRGVRDSLGSKKALGALRATALPAMTQQIDIGRPLAAQVERLNVDVPSRLVVLFSGEPIGSIDLEPDNPEPLLAWIVEAVASGLSKQVLVHVAHAALVSGARDPVSRMMIGQSQ